MTVVIQRLLNGVVSRREPGSATGSPARNAVTWRWQQCPDGGSRPELACPTAAGRRSTPRGGRGTDCGRLRCESLRVARAARMGTAATCYQVMPTALLRSPSGSQRRSVLQTPALLVLRLAVETSNRPHLVALHLTTAASITRLNRLEHTK